MTNKKIAQPKRGTKRPAEGVSIPPRLPGTWGDELVPAVFKMVSATTTLNRAIEACGEAKDERSGSDG